MKNGGEGEGTRIQSVARASQLLLWVAQQAHGATAKEIAEARGLALPTAYHLVNTLVDEGLLTKDARRRYVLGRNAAILAQAYLRGKSVSEGLLAGLRELARRTGETVYLADWGEYDIRVLASVESSHIVRVAEVASGPYADGHARANGKVLLAYAWPEVRQAYLRSHPLTALTPNTIVEPDALEAELRRIRRRGYGMDLEEYALGVSCVAAPLLQSDLIIAAYGVSVPTDRFKKRRAELTEQLLDVVAQVAAGDLATGA
ncbi:IclR family transcriptional regulator [Conexibacter arvalis]|uniref:DNA-binding IclR family transcriptional regulator n=1 Tax=Conexibacter arvalis TaxID=912552 RepID=A0A840I8R5_9ACTN|nr:IclR family transcriptional regulator [Conexibacter arvalis]MBB4660498.1 DNA-binding IclR family transcriptional regulator [Conexibacter arvalis]